MGYYGGSGVNVSKRSYTNCIWNQWVPGAYVDGVPMFWRNVQVYRNYTEIVSRKSGVAEPDSITSSNSVDDNGVLISSTTQSSQRVGDSNLWTIDTNTITSTTT